MDVISEKAFAKLQTALAALAQEVLAVVRQLRASGAFPERRPQRIVREIDANTGQVSLRYEEDEPRLDLSAVSFALSSLLAELTTFDDLAAVIADDPELAAAAFVDAAGNPLADKDSERFFLSQFLAEPFVRYLLGLRHDLDWDEASFAEVFDDLVRHLNREPWRVELLAPLEKFQSELLTIEFDQATSIIAIDDDLLTALFAQAGGFADRRFGGEIVTTSQLFDWTHAIRHEHEQAHPAKGVAPAPTNAIADLVTALRLLRESGVRAPRIFTRPLQRIFHFAGGIMTTGFGAWFPFGVDLILESSDLPTLERLFERLRQTAPGDDEAGRRFQFALGRVNTAAERISTEDRLIDYWIAIETLFVPDSRAEIGFRARNRVARFIASERDERIHISRHLKRSYDRRSKIVHGDPPAADTAAVTTETGELLRRALRLLLDEGERIDLEALDLG